MTINTIIEGCRRKKPRCQRELVVRFSPGLLTVARRYAPDNAMAQDILQDSLVRILERIEQYAGTGSFEGWMRRVVISTALKQLDRKWMRREISVSDQKDNRSVAPVALDALAVEDILACVLELPDGYRQVFNLYAVEGYAHREIAQMIGCSESNSRSQYTRARQALQTILAQRKIVVRHAE
ncbi:MAG: sigma-70 family RNA polymerase sigma factor [Bacteroidota bacterium]